MSRNKLTSSPASALPGIARAAAVAAALAITVWSCQLPIGGNPAGKAVTGVELNKESLTLAVGATEKLVATVSPSAAANKAVSWESSGASVGVSSTGVVTGVSAGSAVIKVTTLDGSFTDTCAVTVVAPVRVTGVTLDRESATVPYGSTLQLAATVLPADATNKAVTWSSSGAVASVSAGGLVTASALGSATITVTTEDGAKTDTFLVTVVPSITLNKSSLSLNAGKSEKLVATIAPASAPNKTVTWTTSDPDIAAVSNGLVLGISAGTATVIATAADGSQAASCAVTVTGSLSHTYSEVLPAAAALQDALNAALATNDSSQSAYCEFVTTPSWLVTIHLNSYKGASTVYTISGTITAPVNPDYTIGALNGAAALSGGIVSEIAYHDAVFQDPRSGTVDLRFIDSHRGTIDLATGTFTEY